MELILILLTGTFMGALFVAFFYLGMRYEKMIAAEKKKEDGLELTDHNVDGVKELYQWLNYGGKR